LKIYVLFWGWIKMENDNELDEVRDEVRKYMQDEEEAALG
jgi:hypothetical protein